jgi:hypothetical protein
VGKKYGYSKGYPQRNAAQWKMGFNSAFKGLIMLIIVRFVDAGNNNNNNNNNNVFNGKWAVTRW